MGDTSSSDFKPALPAQQQPVLRGCGLRGIGQTDRRFAAGKGYKNPSFAQNARFIIDDERRRCQPYFSPQRGNFFLFPPPAPHLVAARAGSYNWSTGLSTHLYKKYCDVHSLLLSGWRKILPLQAAFSGSFLNAFSFFPGKGALEVMPFWPR